MRQFELVAPKTFEKHEVPIPEPSLGEVRIAVKSVGICGSDIHAYYGEHPFMSFPIVLGHECSGVVEKIGTGVTRLSVGDRVVLRPQDVCWKCRPCREGRYNICESLKVLGCQSAGGCSDYYVAKEELFYRIPDKIGFGEGTMIEPLAVAVHAVKRAGTVEGKKVLVLGAGTIGNLVAQSAKGLGASTVMVTDVSEEKLSMALNCGVDYAVDILKEDLGKVIKEKFGEDGVDVVYECTANPGALNQMLSIAGKGIPMVIVGVFAGMPSINLANVQDREYELLGTLMYVENDYLESIRLIEEGNINLKILITGEYPIEELQKAYQYIEEHKDTAQKLILNI